MRWGPFVQRNTDPHVAPDRVFQTFASCRSLSPGLKGDSRRFDSQSYHLHLTPVHFLVLLTEKDCDPTAPRSLCSREIAEKPILSSGICPSFVVLVTLTFAVIHPDLEAIQYIVSDSASIQKERARVVGLGVYPKRWIRMASSQHGGPTRFRPAAWVPLKHRNKEKGNDYAHGRGATISCVNHRRTNMAG